MKVKLEAKLCNRSPVVVLRCFVVIISYFDFCKPLQNVVGVDQSSRFINLKVDAISQREVFPDDRYVKQSQILDHLMEGEGARRQLLIL
jgi:hypothetical protein